MTFPTSSSRAAANGVISEAILLKRLVTQAIAAMASGPRSGNEIISLCQRLNASKVNILGPAQAVPAVLSSIASDLSLADGTAANVAITGIVTAITNSIAWVVNNFPKDVNGFILKDTLNADGSISVRAFTAAQTAGFRAQLQTIVDAIQ